MSSCRIVGFRKPETTFRDDALAQYLRTNGAGATEAGLSQA
ncbi:hypothetical protein SAMN04488125_10153 [Methylorubrum salsuginis]|uniref:Uncharacterized protein n=1 Tax=Methylorubrum salsuginis TaxID=414703 RepID=A0A1I3Y5H1_9HYPH|nr:hypothetical protein SAMN04488125_10153 [Methylorubrum salsuginis]